MRFLDLLKRPYEGLYHEIRKAGDKYATSAGNADGDGNGVWMKLTVGTVLDVAVKDPKTKAMMTLYPPVVVPATKSTLVITAPHFKETTKLQPREGEQGSYQRKTHTVKQGETLESIAKQYDTTWQVLHQLNKDKIKDADKIQVGLVLKVPPKDSGLRGGAKASSSSPKSTPNTTKITSSDYTVQQGDTLGSIAQRSGKSIADLQRLNGIHDPNKIKAGQRLKTGVPNQPPKANTTPKSTTPASQNGGILDDITKTVKEGADWVDKTTQPLQDKVSQAINEGGQALSSAADAVTGWFGGGDKTSSNTPTSAQAPSGKVADKPVQKSTTQDNSQKTGTPKLEVSTKGDCVCQTYNLIWGGHPNVTCEFRKKVVEICKELWADDWLAMANNLMAIFAWESGQSFKADAPNKGDSGGTGLIQIIPNTYKSLAQKMGLANTNPTTEYVDNYWKNGKRLRRIKQLAQMSEVKQLDWVKQYFMPLKGKKLDFVDLYLYVLFPVSSGLPDHVVFARDKGRLDRPNESQSLKDKRVNAFAKNNMDKNGDGRVMKSEIAVSVEHYREEGGTHKNRSFKASCGTIQRPTNPNSDIVYVNIKRTIQNSQCTIGEVKVDKFNFSCYCLERPGPDTTAPNLKKRIPIGTYSVIKHEPSGKNGSLGWAFKLFNEKVAKERLILIHIGNYPKDTEGCILFGSSKGVNSVGNSTQTIKQFYALFKDIPLDKIKIRIEEDYQ